MRIRFGPFTIDPDTRQLRQGETDCHLPPKAFDLLWHLIEDRPKVLEKSELHRRIWPDTFVVDGNLNVLIGQIRQVLEDEAQRPRYIRTVHGVGYAFCGEVTNAQELAPATPVPTRCWLVKGEKTFGLVEGNNVIGRDPECGVWLNSPSVSRRHARITVDSRKRRVTLEDLNSSNGTMLNGVPIDAPANLSDGAEITFGSVAVRLQQWDAEKASETKRIPKKRR